MTTSSPYALGTQNGEITPLGLGAILSVKRPKVPHFPQKKESATRVACPAIVM